MRKFAAQGLVRLALAASLFSASNVALAWIYPEHRELSLLAVSQLDSERRLVFHQLWQEARGRRKALVSFGGR
jgi:hypothetical protein